MSYGSRSISEWKIHMSQWAHSFNLTEILQIISDIISNTVATRRKSLRQAINQSQPIFHQELGVDIVLKSVSKRHNNKSFGAGFISSRIKRCWIKYPCRKRKKKSISFPYYWYPKRKGERLKGSLSAHPFFISLFSPHTPDFFFSYSERTQM